VAEKTYRPKANAENLSLDINIPNTETGGALLSISSWPYATEDPLEQRFLDDHPLVTDRPPPKSQREEGGS
jgi:hypothetical protein